MMKTVDTIRIQAGVDQVFAAARQVTAWPRILSHYRWVRVLRGDPERACVVEMAAWRPFGIARWPTWWVSEMAIDPEARTVRYRHVQGITTGMDVTWTVVPAPGDGGAIATIVHTWHGPRWPLLRRPAAEWVIGPVFVHGIASRTLAGLRRHLESHA